MPQSQSYSVTAVNLPQPHVQYDSKRRDDSWFSECKGWLIFVSAGALAMTFMVTVNVFGGSKVFPQAIDIRAGIVPLVKEGSLQVYPFLRVTNNGYQSLYSLQLPSNISSQLADVMDAFLNTYPKEHSAPYRNCWLENPSRGNPCFYDVSWISQVCSKEDSYGYSEKDGEYNPCFVITFKETGDWYPRTQPKHEVSLSVLPNYDPGFTPIDCSIKDFNSSASIQVYPPKGYSHTYFPMSNFNPDSYLAPLVAVKVAGIQKGQNVTVASSIVTPNSYHLNSNGRATVTFSAV